MISEKLVGTQEALEVKIHKVVTKCGERKMSGFVHEMGSFSKSHIKHIEKNADEMVDILVQSNDWVEDVQYIFCKQCDGKVVSNHKHWD